MSDKKTNIEKPLEISAVIAWVVFISVLTIGLLALIFPQLFSWEFWQSVTTDAEGKITTQRDPSALIRNIGLIFLSAGALYFAWWRSTTADGQLALAERGHDTDRFQKAVGMLDNEDHSIKIAGILFLRNIAEESPKRFARNSLEILSSFVVKRSHQHHHVIDETPSEERRNIDTPPPDLKAAFEALPIIRDKCEFSSKEETWEYLKLTNVDLSGYHLSDIDFSGANLRQIKLGDATFFDSSFRDVSLVPIDAAQSSFNYCSFENAYVAGINIGKISFEKVNFSNTDFRFARTLTQHQLNCGWAWADRKPRFPLGKENISENNLKPANLREKYEKNKSIGPPDGWIRRLDPNDQS